MIAPNTAKSKSLSHFLRMAVVAGVESAVQVHIDRGDDLDARDSHGLTPLMLSAARNRPTICKMLLDAGADASLLAPSGETALAIALAAGAIEAAELLNTACGEAEAPSPEVPEFVPIGHAKAGELSPPTSIDPSSVDQPGCEIGGSTSELSDETDFDLSGWEADDTPLPPEEDPSIAIAATAIQTALSSHEPVDDSTEWDDIEAYLPPLAAPLARADDAEARGQLRLLLLRAIREGSVPIAAVEDLALNDDRTPNVEVEALLTRVINDLGAEVDERFEYATSNESFQVFVHPDESSLEEVSVDEALATIDGSISHRSDPLRLYQREFQRLSLISAEEEIALGRAMEAALASAVDALAEWPQGVAWTIAAGNKVRAQIQPLTWMSLGSAEVDAVADRVSDQVQEPRGEDEPEDETDTAVDTEGHSATSSFIEALDQLTAIPMIESSQGPQSLAIRSALANLKLNRRFLQELADSLECGSSPAATRFSQAMQAHQKAREDMTNANLKLAFFLAKKYLYSGEPLEDLAQEANIGLIKAVERYDWRRGFRFSTYATWWIRQQVSRYVADKGRTIRIPVHVHEKLHRLERLTSDLESSLGRHPSVDELAAGMEMPSHKVPALQRLMSHTVSVHDLYLDDLIATEARDQLTSPDPEQVASQGELIKSIDNLLRSLKAKEAQIIRLRFGVGVQDAYTLDEIGRRFELTRERIRQIESKAIKKLKRAAIPGSKGQPDAEESDDDHAPAEVGETVDVPSQAQPSLRIETESPARPRNVRTDSRRISGVNRLLQHAAQLGVSTSDEREGSSGRVWVYLSDIKDTRYRGLARRLNDFGFTYMPGQGYCK